jgi:hypothetical protein
LLNLLPDDIFKCLLTISVVNPDDTYYKTAELTALDKKIKDLTERKNKGKLSKKQR